MIHNEIKTIPHNQQRYCTVGDYYDYAGVKQFRISRMHKEEYEFLVSIHEQIEEFLTRRKGIREEVITAFDKEYETRRLKYDISEPGDSPLAPYHKEHVFATFIEKLLAIEMNIDWREYEQAILDLDEPIAFGP